MVSSSGGVSDDAHETLMAVREVAAALRVKPVTVYNLCAQGKLTHVRVSNAVRVASDAIARYLNQRKRC